MRPNTKVSFWQRFVPESSGCWKWSGYVGMDGYGRVTYHMRDWRTHRLAWVFTFGEIPEGYRVCHHCDNTRCGNPVACVKG